MKKWRIGSLFSGIGGLELGLERAGLGETLWHCEREKFAQVLLKKHWPDAKLFDDVTTMGVNEEIPPVDIICGGFPCQDISTAGKGAGLEGKRSGLFFELMRIVSVVRPSVIVLENVAALIARGLDRVLGTITEVGYDATWAVVPAADVGAPHRRERIFIIGVRRDQSIEDPTLVGFANALPGIAGRSIGHVDAVDCGEANGTVCETGDVADTLSLFSQTGPVGGRDLQDGGVAGGSRHETSVGPRVRLSRVFGADAGDHLAATFAAARGPGGIWDSQIVAGGIAPGTGDGTVGATGKVQGTQSGVGGTVDGIPPGVDRPAWERNTPRTCGKIPNRNARLKALGNAVVPQVSEFVGRRIMAAIVED